MGHVQKKSLSLTTSGAGAASGVIHLGFDSDYYRLVRIKVDYSATADVGTDLTITDDDGVQVFANANANTDLDVYPSAAVVDAANAAVTNGQVPPLVTGPLTVAFAGGGATKTNVVTVWIEN